MKNLMMLLIITLFFTFNLFAKECKILVTESSPKAEWTAFKTSEKIGVNGSFAKGAFKFKNEQNSIEKILLSSSFSLETGSVSTNNPTRDQTLLTNFFKNLVKSETITGKVVSVKGDDKKGVALISLDLNGVSKEIAMDYSATDVEIVLSGKIDLVDFKALDALSILNKACLDLHKGKDGVSKTWSEVLIKVSASFTKKC